MIRGNLGCYNHCCGGDSATSIEDVEARNVVLCCLTIDITFLTKKTHLVPNAKNTGMEKPGLLYISFKVLGMGSYISSGIKLNYQHTFSSSQF